MAKQKAEQKQNDQNEKRLSRYFRSRGFRFGSIATAFTVLFLAIIVLLNVGLTVLSSRVQLSVDLTKQKNYELSSETLKMLKSVNEPVVITVLCKQSDYENDANYNGALKLMQQYPKYNHNISLRFLDYDKNPAFVSKYASESLQQYDVFVSGTRNGKERYKKISSSDLMVAQTDQQTGQQSITGNNTEQQIDTAIQYLSTSSLPTVLFTTGHNEADTSAFQSLLKSNNYTILTQNLSTSTIPSNVSMVVIADPQTDFSSAEIDKLDKFLDNGGKMGKNAMIFFDPSEPSLANLEGYSKEWGIQPQSGVLYDQNGYSIAEPLAGTIDSDSTGGITTSVGTDLRESRPLNLLFDTRDNRTTKSIVSTPDTTRLWNPPDLSQSFSPSDSDKKGPFTVMAKGSKTASSSSTQSNLIVSGSFRLLDQDNLQSGNKNNAKLVLGVMGTVSGFKASISIQPKSLVAASLSLTGPQRVLIAVVFVVIIPLGILIAGIVQWLRRRHL